MNPEELQNKPAKTSAKDRRGNGRYALTLEVSIKFSSDGTPFSGQCIEMGPNGMRLMTKIPLVEASYVHISFQTASNNTYSEGRVVWTKRAGDKTSFESGIDIQRWGGGIPGQEVVEQIPTATPKKDRRAKTR